MARPDGAPAVVELGAPAGGAAVRLLVDAGIAEVCTVGGQAGVVGLEPGGAVQLEVSGHGGRLRRLTVHGMPAAAG